MQQMIVKAFLMFLLVFSAKLYSQQPPMEPGYLIGAKGDTIRGDLKINPKKEFDHYFRVTFKDASGAQKTYKPNKIKGYGFKGKHFVAITENDESLFYERLTDGPIILYRSAFESVHMNETIREYAYYLFKEGDKKLTEVKENKFKKQIQEWMSGSAEFASEYVEEKHFNVESAVVVISKYNEWKKNNQN